MFYEAAVESCYPVDEVVTSSALTLVFNIACAVYTFLGSRISPEAMNWLLTGCCAGCTLGLTLFTELRRRNRVDVMGCVDDDAQAVTGKDDAQWSINNLKAASESTPLLEKT